MDSLDEKKNSSRFKSVSISTAAAVLLYPRIHMGKLMLYVLPAGE